ncbi:MAG: hypothetical protein ACF8CY_01575, partial [Gimesia chilikensis]
TAQNQQRGAQLENRRDHQIDGLGCLSHTGAYNNIGQQSSDEQNRDAEKEDGQSEIPLTESVAGCEQHRATITN